MPNPQQLITDNLNIWTAAIENKATTGRGSNKKQHLYGIKKLRELILELAVRGLLVPQDPNDEPASVLLQKIAAEKAQMIKEGKIKKQKPLPEITDEEKPFDLPKGWEWVRLAEIAKANTGYAFKSSEYVDEGTFVLRVTNIDPRGSIDLADSKYIEARRADDVYAKFKLEKDDILLVMVGGSLGKIGIVTEEALPAVLNQNMWKISRFYGIELKYFTMGLSFINKNQLTITKSTHGHLSQGDYFSKLYPLPPEAEQPRIVAKVNELMDLCDQLEQQTETSLSAHQTLVETLLKSLLETAQTYPGHTSSQNQKASDPFQQAWQRIWVNFDVLFTTESSIDQLKQTILQLAVMGKLVPQDDNNEPASVLLEKIAAEKAQLIKDGKIKKQKPLPEITDEEKPFDLPKGWEWVRIGNSSLRTDYGLSDKSEAGGEGVPVLAMGHIQEGEVLLGGQKTVPPTVDSLPELYLENRDLLYNRTNSAELVGKTGLYKGNAREYTFASYLIRIRTLTSNALPEFLNLNMQTPLFRETQIVPHLKQQCGQANVNGTIMKNMIVALAPENEQPRIVAKVDELMALCDTLKERLRASKTTQLHLADAMAEQALN